MEASRPHAVKRSISQCRDSVSCGEKVGRWTPVRNAPMRQFVQVTQKGVGIDWWHGQISLHGLAEFGVDCRDARSARRRRAVGRRRHTPIAVK
jgi:hypothetical protein